MTSSNVNISSVTGLLCGGIHRSPVNSPHHGQWRGALMFSFICAWINGWVNNREAGDFRRHHAHYNVMVMHPSRVSKACGCQQHYPTERLQQSIWYCALAHTLFRVTLLVEEKYNPVMVSWHDSGKMGTVWVRYIAGWLTRNILGCFYINLHRNVLKEWGKLWH